MIAFDPDEIVVEDDGSTVEMNPDGSATLHTKWGMRAPQQEGTAYIRISPQLRDFFKLCNDKHGVIGFEYDFDEAGLNFGLILKRPADEEKKND